MFTGRQGPRKPFVLKRIFVHSEADRKLKACGNKRRHVTAEEARKHADWLSESQGQKYSVYRCSYCRFLHAGH